MKSAVETLNPTRVKVTVEVPFEELKPSLDAAYKKIAQQIQVPGFRKGKVPAVVIDQRVGREAVLDEAVNEALPELYMRALQENNIVPMSQPQLDLDEFADGADLTFTAELDTRPTIELPDYHGMEAEVETFTVGEDEIDEQMETLRERFATFSDIERPAADHDFVTIDLTASKDGEQIEEAKASGMSYQVGRSTMLDGLDEALVGMSAGEDKTFPSTLVGGEFKDQPVDVTVTVTAVQEQQLPDLDDDFAQTASEFDTVGELKADLLDRLTRGARVEQAAAARDAVLERLLATVDIPLPDGAVADELQARRDQINEQLAYAGMSEADYLESEGQNEEEFAVELDKRVRDAMAAQLLLDAVADAESVGVDEGELTQHLMRRAQQSGQTPEQYMRHAMEHNHLPELMAEVRRGKALAHIVETATVKDTAGEVVELRTLQPDGTYADAAELAALAEAADDAAGASASPSASSVVTSSDYLTVEGDES